MVWAGRAIYRLLSRRGPCELNNVCHSCDMSEPISDVVQRVLDGALVTRVERIEPWFVFRVYLDAEPRSVIVKQLRDDPNGWRIDPAQVATEVAALRFVERLGLDIAPRLLAVDGSAHALVLEDLHPRVPLPEVLIDGDPALAEAGLLDFAHTLGSLNAGTAGRDAAFAARSGAQSPEEGDLDRWRETLGFVEAFGVDVPPGVTEDIGWMFDELGDPGAFLAMSNGDAATNNFLVAPGLDGKLIDYEFARFRHALLDVVCFFVHGPQWVTLPDPGPREDAYRSTLACAVPEAEDDARFGLGLSAACLSYALLRLQRLQKLAPRRPGDLSRLQLVATLEAAARVAAERGFLRELGGWCAEVAAAIRRRWRDTDVDLGPLPPWLSRDERSERIIDDARLVSDGA